VNVEGNARLQDAFIGCCGRKIFNWSSNSESVPPSTTRNGFERWVLRPGYRIMCYMEDDQRNPISLAEMMTMDADIVKDHMYIVDVSAKGVKGEYMNLSAVKFRDDLAVNFFDSIYTSVEPKRLQTAAWTYRFGSGTLSIQMRPTRNASFSTR